MRHMTQSRHSSAAIVGAVLALALLGPVQAQDSATSFEGTHDAGGTVRFTIGPAGGQIVALELEGLAGGGCSWGTVDLGNWGGAIPFADGAFAATNPDGDAIQGQFVDASRAEGTVQVRDPDKGCETPALRWVASLVEP
jgi:hypothetical protein